MRVSGRLPCGETGPPSVAVSGRAAGRREVGMTTRFLYLPSLKPLGHAQWMWSVPVGTVKLPCIVHQVIAEWVPIGQVNVPSRASEALLNCQTKDLSVVSYLKPITIETKYVSPGRSTPCMMPPGLDGQPWPVCVALCDPCRFL